MPYVNTNLGLITAGLIKAGLIMAGLMLACGAGAQSFPAKPVKIVVPWAAGSSVDIVTRVVSNAIGAKLSGIFVVENKPGATGAIGTDSVAASPADGCTLLTIRRER